MAKSLRYYLVSSVGIITIKPYKINIGVVSDSKGQLSQGAQVSGSSINWFNICFPLSKKEILSAIKFFEGLDKANLPMELTFNSNGPFKFIFRYTERVKNRNHQTIGYRGTVAIKKFFHVASNTTQLTSKDRNIFVSFLRISDEFYNSIRINGKLSKPT